MSDMEFYRNGELDGEAGVKFLSIMRKENPDLPCILQSSILTNRRKAEELEVTFFHKQSQFLLKDLRNFIVENLGFGDLVFRDVLGGEIGRAKNLHDFEKVIPESADGRDSLSYEAKGFLVMADSSRRDAARKETEADRGGRLSEL